MNELRADIHLLAVQRIIALGSERGSFSVALIRKNYGLFAERGLGLYASFVLVVLLFSLLRRLLEGPPFDSENCADFMWIWLSSHFAATGHAAQAYDYSVFYAAKEALLPVPVCVIEHFDYPPTILFFTYPLHLFSYGIAFTAWIAVTMAIYLIAIYAIIPHRNSVIVALTISPAIVNIGIGHDGFLTAGIFGLSLLFAEKRPRLAGTFLALLTYKPQFGILFPVALAASRNWRTIFAGTIASISFALAAAVAFGPDTWAAFMHALVDRAQTLNKDPKMDLPLASVLFLLRTGISSQVVWTIQLALSATATVTVCLIWAKSHPYALKAAALAAGALIASPHVISYDFCILAISTAFFIRDGLARGFLRGDRAAMVLCWIALLFIGPVPLLGCLVMLGLVTRRALRPPALGEAQRSAQIARRQPVAA